MFQFYNNWYSSTVVRAESLNNSAPDYFSLNKFCENKKKTWYNKQTQKYLKNISNKSGLSCYTLDPKNIKL